MNYDPNLVNSGGRARQTVELTFQVWEYKAVFTVTVQGEDIGLLVIKAAVQSIEETMDYSDEIFLTNAEGDTLGCELWEHDLEEMLVGARIVDIEPMAEEGEA